MQQNTTEGNVNRNKVTLAAGFIAACLLAWAAPAKAATQDSFVITVNITNALSVSVVQSDDSTDRTQYDFGDMAWGDTSISSAATGGNSEIRLNNDSGGLIQTYDLSIEDGGSGMDLITTSAALGDNDYRVRAVCHDSRPTATGDFGNEDILDLAGKTATEGGGSETFSRSSTSAGEDCKNTLQGGDPAIVNLWLLLELASSGSATGLQNPLATVYVTAGPQT